MNTLSDRLCAEYEALSSIERERIVPYLIGRLARFALKELDKSIGAANNRMALRQNSEVK